MGFLEIRRDQMEIPHRRHELRVTQHAGEPNDIAAVLEIARRKRMSKPVEARFRNPCTSEQPVVRPKGVALPQPRSGTGGEQPVRLSTLALRPLLPSKQHAA